MAAGHVFAETPSETANTMSPEEIGAQLSTFIDPKRILTRAIDRIAFASDASLYRLIPRAVVQPIHADEVSQLFQYSRKRRIPLTFRCAGTSLSGQAITDGILVDVGRYWRSACVEEEGRLLRVQPGLIGQQANQLLNKHGAKIGPDPASIGAARLGGILSNNASGMRWRRGAECVSHSALFDLHASLRHADRYCRSGR